MIETNGNITSWGRKLYQHGKIKAAFDVANQYVEAFPQNSQALDDLADVYEAMGDKKKAIMLFEKSAKLDPFDANAVENLRWVGHETDHHGCGPTGNRIAGRSRE